MTQIKRLFGARDEVISVNGSRYLVPFQDTDADIHGITELSLVTVIDVSDLASKQVTGDWLRDIVENYKAHDDVFQEAFLNGIIFSGANADEFKVTPDIWKYSSTLGYHSIRFLSTPSLLPGPYVYIGGRLRDAWLLQDDTNGTLMASIRPQTLGSVTFDTSSLKSVDDFYLSVPLRSRLKTKSLDDSPIQGWRIFVKDNIDIKGVKTSLGNRAYYDLYPPRSATAESIQRVIDRGVTICGKTKLNSFGAWEEPTEYIDYLAPFNPRGDGYQSTGGSSSGSAAAVSSYDWLDIAIGTDTWGSVTRPAQWCGCFGLRPTVGAVSTNGVEPYAPKWDTPGILGRDIARLGVFAAEWLLPEGLAKDPQAFTSILWPTDFWSIIDQDQINATRSFVSEIERYLGVSTEEVSFVEEWAKSTPSEANGLSLLEFISTASACQAYDAYHNEDDFRKQYQESYGKYPFISPRIQRIWGVAEKMTKDERDEGYAKIEVYRKWFEANLRTGTRSNTLIVMPQENTVPRYRDEPPSFRRPPQDGLGAMALAAVLESPGLTVPIGQRSYMSKLSRNEEFLPLTVTLVSSPGTDLFLLQTVQRVLEAAHRPTCVETGKVMYSNSAEP